MPNTLNTIAALLLGLASASACQGLGCSLTGEILYRALPEGDITLQLNFSEDQSSAEGLVRLAAGLIGDEDSLETSDVVNATLEFSARGQREALITWLGASGTNWSALLVGSDPNHIWLSGSDGLMAELTRATIDRSEEDSEEGPAKNQTSTSLTTVEPMRLGSSDLEIGTLHRFRSLAAADVCLSASRDDPTPQFGACGNEDALWEIGKGRSPTLRALKHHSTGLCLQRRCYSDKASPLRLGKCGECGTARWKLEGGFLASQAVVGSNMYCVGHEPPSAPKAQPADAAASDETKNATAAGDDDVNAAANATNAANAVVDEASAVAEEVAAAAAIDADASGTDKAAMAWSTACGALADPIAGEAARMTLSLPAYSADTLLDDWLASVASSQRSEVKALRSALGGVRSSLAAARQTMSAEAAKSSEEQAKLSSTVEALSKSLAAKTEEAASTSDSLANTQKQLKIAGAARADSLAAERKWRSELADVTEKAAALEDTTAAANAEMEKAVKRASVAEVAAKQLNASLSTARAAELEATEKAASEEAKRQRLTAESEALAKRAKERQAALDEAVGRASACEGRIREEWTSQKECKARAEAASACEAKLVALRARSEDASKAADEARAAAAGKNESDAAAAECATARREATAEAGRLESARAKLRTELSAAQATAQAALAKEGAAAEAAKVSRGEAAACAKEAKATATRLGDATARLEAASQAGDACRTELGMYQTYLGPPSSASSSSTSSSGVPTSGLARAGRAVWFLVASDWAVLTAHVRSLMSDAPSRGGAPTPPSLVTVPISARPMVYLCALLLVVSLVHWLQLRAARERVARDRELLRRAQERLLTLQRMLDALDPESTKRAMAALNLAADGGGGRPTEEGAAKAKANGKA